MTRQYMIMTLEAPMMSFGATSVDRLRPTGLFPGRSMLTGLIGNALGWRRQDHLKLQGLEERIRYAARVEHQGEDEPTIMSDYQTAEVHQDDRAWTTSGRPEGRGGSKQTYEGPEPRTLEYVVDSRVMVALRLERPEEHPTLEEVSQALQTPARPLHIGRKCCIPETMIFTGFREAETATKALMEEPARWNNTVVQWDPGEGNDHLRLDRERWTSDTRDWANRIHTGRRRVSEGIQQAPEDEKQEEEG